MIRTSKNFLKTTLAIAFVIVLNLVNAQNVQFGSPGNKTDTLHLFLIGNSFSQNATRYLPQLAEEGGHHLVIGRAEIGGCTLQKHWELAELAEANPNDPKGRPYNGKSLRMLLSQGTWNTITLQQYSLHSGNRETYEPYARKLYDYIKSLQPGAKVVLHQTWAYRADSKDFSQLTKDLFAKDEKEMWQKSRAAYRTIAQELGVRVIPVGDAFNSVSSDRKHAFRKDLKFDYTNPVYPALPDQANSLHRGYNWDNNQKLIFDSHHANDAGCYLGALVWYTFLFGDSPENFKFVPATVSPEFAAYLKKVAKKVVK